MNRYTSKYDRVCSSCTRVILTGNPFFKSDKDSKERLCYPCADMAGEILRYRKAPSVKRLIRYLGITKDIAEQIRDLIHGHKSPKDYDSVKDWTRQCYNMPSHPELVMCAINELIAGYGTEGISSESFSCYKPVIEYVNMGDTYTSTIYYSYDTENYYLGSYGDWVEMNERKYHLQ